MSAMSIRLFFVRAVLTALFASPGAMLHAASLEVAPVLVEVPAPGVSSIVKLRNQGTKPINAQIRIFRWTQNNGADVLTPTDDVAASPPAVSLKPATDYTVRIVRTTKEPVVQEEAYRLLVDELPEATQGAAATVNIELRYSIPVFFTVPGAPSKLTFDLQRSLKPMITVSNAGDCRVRLAKLKFTDGRGLVANFGDGLAGYVLGHSTRTFDVPASAKGFGMGGIVQMSAVTDAGPIDLKH
jgi:fimbrial chaperone protein